MHKASIYEMSMTQLDIKFLLYTHLPWVVQGKDVAMSVPTLPPHTLSHLNPIHEVRKTEEERYILIALSSSGGGGGGGFFVTCGACFLDVGWVYRTLRR